MEVFVIKAIQAILSLSILVFVHESGHFLAARLFKVRVPKFYLFFNPTISLFRCKKINGKWQFKFFGRNLSDTEIEIGWDGNPVLDERGKVRQKMVDISSLPDDDWRKHPDNTEYGLGWVPVGGYCQVAGMIDETQNAENMASEPQPWEFRTKPAWQRFLVMAGGVLMNFMLAFFIYSMVVLAWGDNYIPMDKTPLYFTEAAHWAGFQDEDILLTADGKTLFRYDDHLDLFRVIDAKSVTLLRNGQEITLDLPEDFKNRWLASKMPLADIATAQVDSIIPGSNAEKAGLQKGDRIISVNQIETTAFAVFSSQLANHKDSEVELGIIRGQDTLSLPARVNADAQLGFKPALPTQIGVCDRYNFFQSIPMGIKLGIRKMTFYVLQLKLIFSKAGIGNLGGLGAIGSLFPAQWNWYGFWMMTALLSIMFGVLNLLPIPALDGGHILFIFFEMITGRKVPDKFLEYAQMTGMILLITLMLYANGMDIVRFFFK